MAEPGFTFEIAVRPLPGSRLTVEDVPPTTTFAELIGLLLVRLGLPADPSGWQLLSGLRPLNAGEAVSQQFAPSASPIRLVLAQIAPLRPAGIDLSNLDWGAGDSTPKAAAEMVDFMRHGDEDADDADEEIVLSEHTPRTSRRPALARSDEVLSGYLRRPMRGGEDDARRATVRYYSRMNPERLYPLLVLITRDMVERVQKRAVEQAASGPFTVKADVPVEIEPVLPGCDCYPPKLTARLGDGDFSATFRVVPRMLGRVEGASVAIRQDHIPLAEIPLESRVVKRGVVVAMGLLTFLLPCLSAVLKHFNVDFSGGTDNAYLTVVRWVFDLASPQTLTLALGLVTLAAWWLTRPSARDVFFDVETVGPAQKLMRVREIMRSDPERARRDLGDLLAAFPDFEPARKLKVEIG